MRERSTEYVYRKATDEEAYDERNISLNPYDLQGQKRCYPHAYANYVTRGEPCFFERNAIDGVLENKGHGNFPYHSWQAVQEMIWSIILISVQKLKLKN